jgi:eukaryotic-like serine/threonine-protein kinase
VNEPPDEMNGIFARRFRSPQRIGVGRRGRVWLVTDDVLRRQVAVKEILLPERLSESELGELRLRTLRDARDAARVSHPNIVRVYDVIFADDRPWIIMEFVASRSLAQVIRDDRALSPRETAKVGIALIDALIAAHSAGVLHRDVKPGNVLIADDGRVMLTDFGLAAFDEADIAGIVDGPPQFIAPERALDGGSSPSADLWSLGATLYAAVEGRSPYSRASSYEILTALATAEPDPMINAGPMAPILTRLLKRDPRKRMPAKKTRKRLQRIVDGPEGDIGHTPSTPRWVPPSPRLSGGRKPSAAPPRLKPEDQPALVDLRSSPICE